MRPAWSRKASASFESSSTMWLDREHLPLAPGVDRVAVRPGRAEVHGGPLSLRVRQRDAVERRARHQRGEVLARMEEIADTQRGQVAGQAVAAARVGEVRQGLLDPPDAIRAGRARGCPRPRPISMRATSPAARRRLPCSGSRPRRLADRREQRRGNEEHLVSGPPRGRPPCRCPGCRPPNSSVRVGFPPRRRHRSRRSSRSRRAWRGRSLRASPPRDSPPARFSSASWRPGRDGERVRRVGSRLHEPPGLSGPLELDAVPALALQGQLRQPVLRQVPVELALALPVGGRWHLALEEDR